MRFIRKNGHVIPIQERRDKVNTGKQARKNAVTGAALIATGTGIAAAAGRVAGETRKYSHELWQKAHTADKLAGKAFAVDKGGRGLKLQKIAVRAIVGSHEAKEASKFINKAGRFGATVAIATGVNQALKYQPFFKKNEKTRIAVATGSTAAAGYVAKAAWQKQLLQKTVKPAVKILKRSFKLK